MPTADRNNPSPFDRTRDGAIEPLPVEFEHEMIEVDRLIGSVVRSESQHVPQGLSQRVFEMSVSSLPGNRAVAQPAIRLAGSEVRVGVAAGRRSYAFTSWSRLALAASVLLVAGVTLWMNWPQNTPPMIANNGTGGMVGGGMGGGSAVSPVTPRVTNIAIDLTDLNTLHASNPSDFDTLENEFTYLLDASEVRSFDDLNADLVLLVQELEM